MKKRCQKLQRAAVLLEDENISLKKQVARLAGDKPIPSSDGTSVHEQVWLKFAGCKILLQWCINFQVAVLMHQRNQLSSRLQLVVSENKQLWRRLSKLNQARQTLEVSLSQVSDTLKQHSEFPSLIINDGNVYNISFFTALLTELLNFCR